MHRSSFSPLPLVALLAFAPLPVQAALGAAPESFAATPGARPAVRGLEREETSAYHVQQDTLPSGTVVRQYVDAGGTVFAVSWEGPTMPALQRLLGPDYFAQYREAARSARTGRGHLGIRQPTLVMHSTGHLRAFFGKAYVPRLLPPGVGIEDIR